MKRKTEPNGKFLAEKGYLCRQNEEVMRYDCNSAIKSVRDVRAFFSYMINDLAVSLHADTPFSEYVNTETGEQTFSSEESKLYDRLMQEAFEVCGRNGGERLIYDLGVRKSA